MELCKKYKAALPKIAVRLKELEQADADIRSIFEYIAFELQSPENASGQLDQLEESIMSLDQMPELLSSV